MDEYISREAVIQYLKGYSEKELNSRGNFGMITSSVLDKAERAISEMPSADVQPVKYGRWIDHEMFERNNCNPCIECSVCNTWFGCDCFPKTKFCPNCGAKLIKDGDSE